MSGEPEITLFFVDINKTGSRDFWKLAVADK